MMKRKLFLGILPAVMVLASCQAGPKVQAKENLFRLEDTVAHEEVFGKAEFGGTLGVRKVGAVAASEADVAVTTQFSAVADGKISIRFVAAINITGELGDNEAKWTRVMYDGDGNNVKVSADKNCIHAYTSVKNGAETLTIDAFNTEQSKPAGYYDYFVVYTMVDIPYETCQNYRLGAYLTLNNSVVSKQLITTVKNDQHWVFNGNHSDFFLKGTIEGVAKEINQDISTKGDDPGHNYASFTFGTKVDDEFEIVQCDDAKFKFFGSDCLVGSENPIGTYFDGSTGKIKTKSDKAGYYILYLNKEATPELWASYRGGFYYLRGNSDLLGASLGDWGIHDELRLEGAQNTDVGHLRITLSTGSFKVAHSDWNDNPKGWSLLEDSGARHDGKLVDAGSDDNIYCNTAGVYDIYLKESGSNWILYIGYVGAAA